MRLGIMGGAFDPIHNAHLYVADVARKATRLEGVLFIPSGAPPHKGCVATVEDRFAMTELAVRDIPWAEPSRIEMDRKGMIYTVDTLELLKKRDEDDLFVIVGADALLGVPMWKEAARAMTMCTLVAVTRPGLSERDVATAERHARENAGARVRVVRADSPDISSSGIRARARGGFPLDGLVPAPVARYIEEKGLYR